ncbi:MAG TPA: fused MFS/spermidine synthase [Vicinamibacteria bacterium]|nr:fused MFS/spermidine synthase [Vicinamibacteria bacterium]
MSLLWAVTVFLGSSLLFVLQPMIAKMLLPRVGGAPSTWTTCVLFFQAVLLAGYVYAHWVGRRRARTQLAIHAALLLLPLGMLPFSIVSGAPGTGPIAPTLWLLRALALAIGPPFFVLAAGAPLLQSWLAGSRLPGSGDPYVLYAASNAGSLIGLAAYPVLIEPRLGLAGQAAYWAGGYALYVVLALACAVRAWRAPASVAEERPSAGDALEVRARQRWQWIALAAAPSSLMLGVTSLLTADAGGLPFLWVLPLALYLLSFVIAFAPRAGPSPRWARYLPIAAVVFMLLWMIKATEPLPLVLGAYLAVLFVAAMACHTELARRRPPPRHLTAYYAYVGAGGVIGGAFNALIAPAVFRDWVEIPLAFTLVCLLVAVRDDSGQAFRGSDAALAAGAFLLTVALARLGDMEGSTGRTREVLALALPVLLTFLLSQRRYRFGLTVGAVLLAGSLDTSLRGQVELTARSSFGVHRVTRDDPGRDDPTTTYRKLYHGTTIHGVQRVDAATGAPVRGREPLGYYSPDSPIGQLFHSFPPDARPKRVGIVGLGAGSLLAYAEPGERWTIFEIDPLVKRIAEDGRLFSYLPEARRRGVAADVVLGDARLTLAAMRDTLDVLVLDAFTGDTIPVHLLTREALELYREKLSPSGVVGCHVSNRHLDLAPLVRDTAEDLGLASTIDAEMEAPPGGPAYVMASRWVFLARSEGALRARSLPSIVWLSPRKRGRTWTDDRSDLWSLFRW